MIYVPDVARALDWYASIGFKELARYEDDGLVNFGMVSYREGRAHAEHARQTGPTRCEPVVLHGPGRRTLPRSQVPATRRGARALAGEPGEQQGLEFEQDIEDMFYGARQFCIRDLNGYQLYFISPALP